MANYALQGFDKEHMAKAIGVSLPISTKKAIEVCKAIKNKNLAKAKIILNDSINEKKAIPFTRFNKNTGHKKKIGPGRFPQKAAKEILSLIEQVEANAQFKGLNTSNLVINHICANKASRPWHYGRWRRIKTKRTHVEVCVQEKPVEEKPKKKEKGKK